jgi:hypothetical protein
MPIMSQLEIDAVSRSLQAAKLVLDRLKPTLDALNVIYDSAGGAKTTITQQGLDEIPAFSRITKTQLDDGMFALTSTLRLAVGDAYTQLAQLASRSNG